MRIAIVNDVALAVEALRRVLASSGEHSVAWIAYDGAEAVRLCARDKPDLILMDLIMPHMDGVEATRQIMARTPCAIVVVTANVNDNSSRVFEAMGGGALDAVNTPVLGAPGVTKGAHALLVKIETIRRLLGAGPAKRLAKLQENENVAPPPAQTGLVAIGASAGGPSALAEVLGRLPASFPGAIVVVQHVDRQFAQGLANWLDYQTPLEVRLAQEDEFPQPGKVFLAGRSNHLILTASGRLAYVNQPAECAYRPSIDTFFESVGRFWPGELVAVLLTGMGKDGAEGLRSLKSLGHHTIAQDQATSAVYGMPKAAAELQAAIEILGLEKIGPRLTNIFTQRKRVHA
jgi:two-component system response regulator WspF